MRRLLLGFVLSFVVSAPWSGAEADSVVTPSYTLIDAPRLSTPVDCAGTDLCSVQNYVDFAPGPEALDHTCGPLTYNGHSGIDIRLKSIAAMERGVAVLAAADGKVIANRNNVPDRLLSAPEVRLALNGRSKLSNSVSLYHGNGWTTHYGHLRKGSVTVRNGETVKRGQQIGLIGASGNTNFPHLHFTLKHREETIDPYSGRIPGSGCGADVYHSFWDAAAAKILVYRASGLLDAGITEAVPSITKLRGDEQNDETLPATATRLVFWTHVWGLRRNDRIRMRLYAANGALLSETTLRAKEDAPIELRSLSVIRSAEPWPIGTYRGEYILERPVSSNAGIFDEVLKVVRKIEVR